MPNRVSEKAILDPEQNRVLFIRENGITITCVGLSKKGFSSSDFEEDKAECADKLVNLATCLPYVTGDSNAPTSDCCNGFKKVVDISKKCLCVLLKDRDDPNLGFKLNSTLALSLPPICQVATNTTECIDLLHLSPNSKDAEFFKESGSTNKGNTSRGTNVSSSSTGNEPSSEAKNDGGGRRQGWVEMQMTCGLLIWFLFFSSSS